MARSIVRAVRGASGTAATLPPLAQHRQRPISAFHTECFDVGAERLREPQAVDGQERDEGVLSRGGQISRYEERAHLVAVQAGVWDS